jgi:hypothetical protein
VITGTFGHVGATLFVAVLLSTGITRQLISPAVGYAQDVGVSYGIAAVGGVCTVRVPRRWRATYLTVLAAVLVGALLWSHTFTDVGHVTAFGVGAGLAVVVSAANRAGGRSPAPAPSGPRTGAATSTPSPVDGPAAPRPVGLPAQPPSP